MLQTIQGIYRNGKIELPEIPQDITESQVFVTFFKPESVSRASQFMSLDLPNLLEQELSLEATRLNVSLSDYILKVLTLRRDWLEEVEDAEDLADASIALLEDGFIPLIDVKRELGIS